MVGLAAGCPASRLPRAAASALLAAEGLGGQQRVWQRERRRGGAQQLLCQGRQIVAAIEAEFSQIARQVLRPDRVIGPVHRSLHVPQRGVHPHQSRGLAAARSAAGHGGLVPAASRLDAAGAGQPVRVHGGPRLEMLPRPALQFRLAEACHQTQPQHDRLLGVVGDLYRGRQGCLVFRAPAALAAPLSSAGGDHQDCRFHLGGWRAAAAAGGRRATAAALQG